MFRWLILAVLLSALMVSGYHRARARLGGETIARRREGPLFLILRGVMALVLFGAVVTHALRPEWMAWASFHVPEAIRWVGLVLGVLTVAAVHWVLRALGQNVSETVLTKEHHQLVTGGPYRWVRHPLYQLLVPGYSEHQEMELLVRAGFSPREALRAATRS